MSPTGSDLLWECVFVRALARWLCLARAFSRDHTTNRHTTKRHNDDTPTETIFIIVEEEEEEEEVEKKPTDTIIIIVTDTMSVMPLQ